MTKDVVCGMDVDEETTVAFLEFPHETFYFCSPQCKFVFLQDPERYIPKKNEQKRNERRI